MLEYLKPFSENHAISKVVATLILPQEFIKPEDIFKKLKELEGFKNYPKKIPLLSTTININNQNFVGKKEEKVRGFIFESYENKGELDSVFKLENTKLNQSTVSLETRKYSRWDNFKQQLDNVFDLFIDENDTYAHAISLNYRDEFTWTNRDELIDVDDIFNIDSELLNHKFIKSRNGTLVLISQGLNESKEIFEEKIEISFNNDQKKIIIDHIYAIQFGDYELFSTLRERKKISDYFDLPHNANKEILKSILATNVQKMIKLI